MRAPHPSSLSQLSLRGVSQRYDDRTVLDQVSFSLAPGEKAGVVGDNGAGKSTLLSLIAGREHPDAGEVTVTAPGGTGYLAQSLGLPPEATVQDAVDLALAELRALEAALRQAERALAQAPVDADPAKRLADVRRLTDQYEARGGYEADSRVDAACTGSVCRGSTGTGTLGTLSGGERSRLALAATLASRPRTAAARRADQRPGRPGGGWLEEHLRGPPRHRRRGHPRPRVPGTAHHHDPGGRRRPRLPHGDGYAAISPPRPPNAAGGSASTTSGVRTRPEPAAGRVHVARLGSIPRKIPRPSSVRAAFRARGAGHGAMSRIRNAKERVERLTETPVRPSAGRTAFTARLATAGPEPGKAPLAEARRSRVGRPAGGATRCASSRRAAAGHRSQRAGQDHSVAGAGRGTDAGRRHGGGAGRVGHLRQEATPWPPA